MRIFCCSIRFKVCRRPASAAIVASPSPRVSNRSARSRVFPGGFPARGGGSPGLTAWTSFITLRIPMTYRVRFLLLFAAACVAFPERSPAPVVFRPSEKARYKAPGEELIIGNANEMFSQAEAAEKSGERGRAIKIYKRMVKRYPRSNLSPEATYRAGRLTEDNGDLIKAAAIYRGLMEVYPQTQHFQEAIESQFRIGEVYLNGKKRKILGVPLGSTLDDAVEIFA